MGFRIAENLLEKGFKVVAYDIKKELVQKITYEGAIGINSLKEIREILIPPRVILLSVPSGEITDKVIEELKSYLESGDIIVDLGNSFYKDTQRRAAYLKEKGIYLIDAGISGGIRGARHGACLMIGGEKEIFERIENVFDALSKDGVYLYFGKSGSGHLVKGYQNLILYGYLQALAEGLVCIYKISEKEGMDISLQDVCKIFGKGSIVDSRIVRDAESALNNNPELDGVNGSVFGQTQKIMEELVKISKEENIDVPCCEAALNARIESQKNPTFTGKIINAIRNIFGGHEEWKMR